MLGVAMAKSKTYIEYGSESGNALELLSQIEIYEKSWASHIHIGFCSCKSSEFLECLLEMICIQFARCKKGGVFIC